MAPGATSWPGSSIVRTMLNPSSATAPQTFTNSGTGFTTIGQTFTVASTNYFLQSIEIYAGGGIGTGAGVSLTLNLFDLGFQAAPTVLGNNFTVAIGASNDAGFFRLHKP